MKKTLDELSKLVKARIIGDETVEITGVGGADNVSVGQITFAQTEEFLELAKQKAAAIIVGEKLAELNSATPLLVVDNPRAAFATIAEVFVFKPYYNQVISPDAIIADNVQLGSGVSIHPGVIIESGAIIGDNVILAPGVYVGHNVKIANDTIIHPNVVIEYDSEIGSRVEVHPGAVIGCEGYGFEKTQNGYIKVPQFGNVIIEDDVEIGANVTIDRAATGSTIVGSGTKIDNLVHIAHNVEIGEDCLLIAQVGVAGSAKLGNQVTLAGKSGVVGHLTIGDNTTVASYSAVTNDVAPNSFISGYPAHDHRLERRIKVSRKKLPAMIKKIRKLEKKINKLEEGLLSEGEE